MKLEAMRVCARKFRDNIEIPYHSAVLPARGNPRQEFFRATRRIHRVQYGKKLTAVAPDRVVVSADSFHTADGTAFVDLMIDGHRETWPVRSTRLRSRLMRKYYQATDAAPGAGATRSAPDLLGARAQFDGPRRAVHIRVAEYDGRIYLDLADDQWRAVEIGPDGWRVITCPPVRFRRAVGLLPLPMLVRGGSVETLTLFFNLPNRSDFVLVVAWLLAALRHGGPYASS